MRYVKLLSLEYFNVVMMSDFPNVDCRLFSLEIEVFPLLHAKISQQTGDVKMVMKSMASD